MKEEIQKILCMLEEHKITSSEAVNLLEDMEVTTKDDISKKTDDIQHMTASINKSLEEFNSKIDLISIIISKNLESVGKDIEEKLKPNFQHISPALEKFSNEYVDKFDKVSDNLNKDTDGIYSKLIKKTADLSKSEGGASKINKSIDELRNYFSTSSVSMPDLNSVSSLFNSLKPSILHTDSHTNSYSKSIDNPLKTELIFENPCGNIYIEGYEGSEVHINVTSRASQSPVQDNVSIIDNQNIYGIKIKQNNNDLISLYINLPKNKFGSVQISSSKGKMQIFDISCDKLICNTKDSRLSLSGLNCDLFEINAQKCKVELSDIFINKAIFNTLDSYISAYNTNYHWSKFSIINGKAGLEFTDEFMGRSEMNLILKNSKLNLDFSQNGSMSFHIDSTTSRGNIGINIPDIIYKLNEKDANDTTHIICDKDNYDKVENSIAINIQSYDSSINING